MTLLALLRHAETPWSREGRLQGRTDVSLSDAGRDSLRLRTLPAEFHAMRIVSSPLQRCLETAALLKLGPLLVEERITEMHWGDWEGHVLADLRADLGGRMQENEARGLDFTPPGGESPREVLGRVSDWLADIARDDSATLAVTHRGVIRVILAAATEWNMLGRPPAKLDWAAVHVFRLRPDGKPSVARLNVPFVETPAALSQE